MKRKWIFLFVAFLIFYSAVSFFTGCSDNPAYTVIYNSNGATDGSVPVDRNFYGEGADVTVLGNSGRLVRSDYAFAGWNTEHDGSGTNYTEGSTFVIGNNDEILYARWAIDPDNSKPSIYLLGETLNDGFAIYNSNKIVFGFNRTRASIDTEISISLPTGISTFSVTKDGIACPVDGITDCTGSFIVVLTSNPGLILIMNAGETAGTSLFVVTIESNASVPITNCDWQVNQIENPDFQFARAIPDIFIIKPEIILSGETAVLLDASYIMPLFEPSSLFPALVIDSYSWTQTAGPAVTLSGADTAVLTFDAPSVAVDTDLSFELTVTDNADSIPGIGDELTAAETVTVIVLAQ